MASHGCINGTLDGTNYSSPVPVIGLYIAAASFVSFFLMLYDVLVGFYTRRRWLPCKMFKLNSITLTLVSIVCKLTVDLTTPMPSVWDQLSKICGTSFLCAYMGYIMPSVGVMKDSTNMYSLSILVITVIVNMGIQISTGVVVLFIPEHIIVLCIMLIMLGVLWGYAWTKEVIKRYTCEITSKSLFTRSKESVFERLKVCYLYGYGSNSQFLACKNIYSFSIGGLNLFCLAILIQAAFRSLIMKSDKFCGGNSDYDWSMPIIVVTQILTIIIGSFVSIFRWLTMYSLLNDSDEIGKGEPYERNPIWTNKISIRHFCKTLLDFIFIIIGIITFPLAILGPILDGVIGLFKCYNDAAIEKFKYLIENHIGIDVWTLGKGLAEMEKEIKVHQSEPNEFLKLLSKITPSQQLQLQSLEVEQISDHRVGLDGESNPVSTLSVVLLVRIAQVCLPKHLNNSLVKTFQEVYEFLCFIEENLFLTIPEFAKKLEVARAVWLANDFSRLVVKTFDKCATGQSQSDTNCALAIISEVKNKMPKDMIYSELSIIESNINHRQYSSIKQLFDYIEQLYIDKLHVILAQFPTATFNALSIESTSEDYQDRVRLALKFVCKIEPLEARIQWKFPQGYNLMGLITTPVLATEEEGGAAVNNYVVLHATEDTIEAETEDTATEAIHDDNDVIIEVEDSNLRTVC